MKLVELVEKLNLRVYAGNQGLHREVTGGYVSDLLSDVMGNADEGEVWITLQGHRNVTAIAGLKDLAGVILVKGIKPDEDTVSDADREGIPVLGTELSTFDITGSVHRLLEENGNAQG